MYVVDILYKNYQQNFKLSFGVYSIAVSRSKEVPCFGPPVPDCAVFKKGPQFAEFLKMKSTI